MSKMSTETNTSVKKRIEPRFDLEPPAKYQVVFMNDDVTSMEFVMAVLAEIFGYDPEAAHSLTMKIHEENSAVVAVFSYEIAEQKAVETTILARNNNFPLDVKIRPDA
jgi:ATP-dependent Clp protease adaptor protein ClpS